MAIIQASVGKLPYLLTDFDQHSYEAPDAFTRFMPKNKLHTAVRPITVSGYDRKVLLANDRIVTALENDLDQAYVPGSLVEMLKQRASGEATDSDRFYEPIQPEYLNRDKRLAQLAEQQIEKSIMYPGGWGLLAEAYLDGVDPLYDNIESFNKWIDEDWGFAYKDTIYAPAMLSMRDLDRACQELDRVLAKGAAFHPAARRPGVRPLTRRPLLRPLLGPDQRGQGRGVLPHLGVPLPGQRCLSLGLGPRAAVPVLGLAVAEHVRRAAHHRHPVGVDLRQPVRSVPEHQGAGERVRRGVGSALHPAHGQEPRHGAQRHLAGGSARRAAERDLQEARPRRALSGGRHRGDDRAARLHRDAAHGLGLAARRRTARTSRVLRAGREAGRGEQAALPA